jgi:hypothetical protein
MGFGEFAFRKRTENNKFNRFKKPFIFIIMLPEITAIPVVKKYLCNARSRIMSIVAIVGRPNTGKKYRYFV